MQRLQVNAISSAISWHQVLKRAVDVVIAALGLASSIPLCVLIGVLIRLTERGPILFSQTRIGQFGRPFRMWKFRTMVVDAEKKGLGVTSGADRRITPIGRVLRKTKLDELPQLWNVLRGDMSLVGPRPEVPRYVEHYTAEQREVLKLRPGITDAATVAFRNEEELLRGTHDVEGFYLKHCLPTKIEMNLAYARRATFLGDLWILFQTLCPYWLGVLALYAVTLVVSLGLSCLLLGDFHWSGEKTEACLRAMPWLVAPQLMGLFWQGQARGLLSYFSVPEMRRTAVALVAAFALQVALVHLRFGEDRPAMSLLLTDLMMSFFSICGVRMSLRMLRERSMERRPRPTEGRAIPVAIIGLGEAATNLALDLGRSTDPKRRVIAFFDDDPATWQQRPHDIPVFGMPECLLNPEWHKKLDEVIITLPPTAEARITEIETMLRDAPYRLLRVEGLKDIKQDSGTQGLRDSGTQGLRDSGTQGLRDSRTQGPKDLRTYGLRNLGA